MSFPIPDSYKSDAADIARDEAKRQASPPSFFFSQSWGLVLAANYFTDERLAGGYSAVAAKHRHRIRRATFGQIMAAFEWCLKDYFAQIVDATDLFDRKLEVAKWIELEKSGVLAQRAASASVGAILIHPTQGWHETETVRQRYSTFFEMSPVSNDDAETLDRLWLLRHSVVHNAGFVTNHDSYRMRAHSLSEKVVRIDENFLAETWDFLTAIVRKLGEPVGTRVMQRWVAERCTGVYVDDEIEYRRLKLAMSVVESRNVNLPTVDEATYNSDRGEVAETSAPPETRAQLEIGDT
jgi:hypothetical protein